MDYIIQARRPDQEIINKKKRKPAWEKIIRNEKRDKYFDYARELKKTNKKLGNINVLVIPIVIGTLGTVANGFETGLEELEIGRRAELVQIIRLLRSIKIMKRVLEIRGDLLSLRLLWMTIS